MRNRRTIPAGVALAFLLAVAPRPSAAADEYPSRPVNLVVNMGAGGSHDLTARAVTAVAKEYLGQPIMVEPKPGGGGAIGADYVAKAQADGYTLLFGGPGPNTGLPAIEGRSKGPDDLVAVCRVNYSPTILVTRLDAPFKTFREMLAWAKANPGKLVFGHTGLWNQADMSMKQIMRKTGIKVRSVPYDGGGPALTALLGGHVDVTGGLGPTLLPHIQSGKIRALAVMDDRRMADLPDVPTAKEEGVDVKYLMWRGVLAPKGTPRPVVEKVAAAFRKMTEDRSVIATVKTFGDEIYFLGPDEFEKAWREEYEQQKEIGKAFKQ